MEKRGGRVRGHTKAPPSPSSLSFCPFSIAPDVKISKCPAGSTSHSFVATAALTVSHSCIETQFAGYNDKNKCGQTPGFQHG